METARCRAFLSAVECGSISKAAEKLDYTPSGVSQLVAALEDEAGFPLLLRTRRGVVPTESGERLLPAVRAVLAQEERLKQTAAEVRGLSVGRVRVASYVSIATHWLPGIIQAFGQAYPQIQIEMTEGVRQEVAQRLDDGQADVGFFSYQDPMPYDWIPLAEDQMLAVLPKDHPLAGAKAYPLENCRREAFIMPARGRDNDVCKMLEENDLTAHIRFSTLGNYAVLAMIERGMGMSIMNELVTANWQCDVVKLPLLPPQQITLGIALPSHKSASPAVRRFVEFAVKWMADSRG